MDGLFLTADPLYLVQQGVIADVPFISGTLLVRPFSHPIERSVHRELR